jgi:hypothetical protein
VLRLFGRKTEPKRPVIVVSGLPRSGTSMMMRMLSEGGLDVVTDRLRAADEDNPEGYFELEAVKQLPAGNAAWLSEAGGRVVKVISSLLEHLPAEYSYKVIFMEREIEEILASQQKMLSRRSEQSRLEDADMASRFRAHLAALKPWLARQPNMDVLYVSYNELMRDAASLCRLVAAFTGMPLDQARMRSVPSGDLYRNRKTPA